MGKAQKQIQLNRAGVFRNYLARLLVARTIVYSFTLIVIDDEAVVFG